MNIKNTITRTAFLRITYLVILILTITNNNLNAQDILTEYIQEALKSNIALEQKEYSYQKSLEALKEAKRMYFPVLSIEAKYSRASGGRTAEIPFGDIMNPAYENLELINQALSGINPSYPDIPAYPEVENYIINFVREKEQETKLQVQMPVFNTAIIQNHKIKKGLSEVEKTNVDIYKRELVKEVKTAYFNCLKTCEILELYKNSLEVVNENLKNTESLFEHDKITIDEVYAAKAKVKEIENELSEANKNHSMATAYLNFLLNRDLNSEVVLEKSDKPDFSLIQDFDSLKMQAINNREEIDQLNQLIHINTHQVKLEKGDLLPNVALGASYGYQGEEYSFTSNDDFAVVGVSLSWNLFTSGQTKARIQQAKIEKEISTRHMYETEKQIELQVLDTWYSLQNSKKSIELANQEYLNYQKNFELINKKHQKGIVNHLEYSNALNNKINAQIKVIISQYEFQIKQIELERITAQFDFEKI